MVLLKKTYVCNPILVYFLRKVARVGIFCLKNDQKQARQYDFHILNQA